METINPSQIEFNETHGDDQSTYTWTRDGKVIANVKASDTSSIFPKIEFILKEGIVPYYEEDKISALDEIGEMQMYSDMQTRTENGYIHGSMRCSHNANLGVGSMVQTVRGWVDKNKC